MSEYYCVNTIKTRKDGPAVILYHDNGKVQEEEYFINGIMERVGGPARIRYHEDGLKAHETYFFDNLAHRMDGPAIIEYNIFSDVQREEYYLHGEALSKIEFSRIVKLEQKIYLDNLNKNNNQIDEQFEDETTYAKRF